MKLMFGKYAGKDVSDVPDSYLDFLSSYNKQPQEEKKLGRFAVPPDIEQEADRIFRLRHYAEKRVNGMTGSNTEYLVEMLGDLDGIRNFDSMSDALSFIRDSVKFPDPEDDRILVWEVLPSGHKKVVWHFSGWHWDADEFHGLEQGTLPGDVKTLYGKAMDDYDGIE